MSIGAFSGVVFFQAFSGIGQPIVQLILAMVCGGIMAGIFGLLIGIPVLRLRGDYLAIVTLAFGEIIKNIINNIYLGVSDTGWHFSFGQDLLPEGTKDILNGPMGVTGNTKVSTFAIGFVLILFTLVVVLNLIRSKYGRAIMAIRDNRIAAESIGLSATKFKLIAFSISAALTGMAGTLYAMNYASVAPSKFNFNTSINILVFVVLGGMGNIRGSIIAAILLTLLPETPLLRGLGEARMLIYAVLLIGMMLLTQSKGGKLLTAWVKDKAAIVLKKTKKEGADNE
jgi:branched-chain amino acid transport system permease protein